MLGRAPAFLPFVVLGIGVAVVSFAAILIRYAHAEGASSLGIAAARLGIAALVLAPLAWMRHGREILALGRRALLLCVLSGSLLALHFWTWISSLEYTSVASSTALVTTNPIWVGLASALLLRERPARAAIAGIVLSIAGSLLIFASDAQLQDSGRAPMLGNLLALLGALAASGYLLVGRALRSGISLLAYVWLAYATAAILLLLGLMVSGASLGDVPPSAWPFLLLLAIGPQLVGHTAFNWALRRLSATFVAVSILGEPLGSTLQFIGFALLLSGIFVAATGERRAASA
jgi:drug/metabolite transporter (DMT)-like permease